MFGLLWDYVLSLGFRIVFNYYLRFLITLYLFLHDLNWNIQSHEVKIFWLDNGSLCLSIVCAAVLTSWLYFQYLFLPATARPTVLSLNGNRLSSLLLSVSRSSLPPPRPAGLRVCRPVWWNYIRIFHGDLKSAQFSVQ